MGLQPCSQPAPPRALTPPAARCSPPRPPLSGAACARKRVAAPPPPMSRCASAKHRGGAVQAGESAFAELLLLDHPWLATWRCEAGRGQDHTARQCTGTQLRFRQPGGTCRRLRRRRSRRSGPSAGGPPASPPGRAVTRRNSRSAAAWAGRAAAWAAATSRYRWASLYLTWGRRGGVGRCTGRCVWGGCGCVCV